MSTTTNETNRQEKIPIGRNIFISHRHEEKNIADIISKHLQSWGIPRDDIFQSSDAKGGVRIGGKLTEGLKEALSKTSLLIFIYTHKMHDWSYCMWECGVAMDPKTEDTNIVVFECAGESPAVFQPDVRVNVPQGGIKQFTYQFHKKDGFFPKQPAFGPRFADEVLDEKAEQFQKDLMKVIPGGEYKETPLLHLIKLSLAPEHVAAVLKEEEPDAAHDYIYNNLLIEEASPYCPQHFGFNTFNKGIKWSSVVERWQKKVEIVQASWISDLNIEIWRAIHNEPARPSGDVFTSVVNLDRQYIPLLCLMREYPSSKMEFNVYLYRTKSGEKSDKN